MTEPKKFVEFDETPSAITDHAFEPRGEWYTVCKHCGIAEAAHSETTVDSLAEIKNDHSKQNGHSHDIDRSYMHLGGRARIGYVSDDEDD